MYIDKRLKLVIPVYGEDNESVKAYVHASSISTEVFRKYFLPISKTFAAIHSEGLGKIAGPRVADQLLQNVCESMDPEGKIGYWADVRKGLVAEIYRLALVLMPSENGWEAIPFEDTKKRQLLDPEDASEVEAAIVFFTLGSVMYQRHVRRTMLEGSAQLWGAQITLSNCTEFIDSLQKSTVGGSSGETATA